MQNLLRRIAQLAGLLFLAMSPLLAATPPRLTLVAHWDDGSAVAGTVSFSQPVLGSPDIPISTKTLSLSGTVSVSTFLAPNTNYNVRITLTDGTALGPFMFSTVGMDVAHLTSLRDTVVFHLADNSIAKETLTATLAY